jgi:16S rRNA (cytidine1402-2'-O)-methyltransferase
MKKASPNVWLVPNNLRDDRSVFLVPEEREWLLDCRIWFAESPKPCMRMITLLSKREDIEVHFPIKDHYAPEEISAIFRKAYEQGEDIGIISDAGCPAIADPGSRWIAASHALGFRVRPLTGPSSFLLVLMASGMYAQSFRFLGYVPKMEKDVERFIKKLIQAIGEGGGPQIFMDTPFRNERLFQLLLQFLPGDYYLCLGVDLHRNGEWIRTRMVRDWKGVSLSLSKKEVVFVVGLL